jgi:hypothetical protein
LEFERAILLRRVDAKPKNRERDLLTADDALRFLLSLPIKSTSGGRRRLEESPSSPARALAEGALRMLASGEVPTLLDAAVRLGMCHYDEERPDLDEKAEQAAVRRLSRYIDRFRKSVGQAE